VWRLYGRAETAFLGISCPARPEVRAAPLDLDADAAEARGREVLGVRDVGDAYPPVGVHRVYEAVCDGDVVRVALESEEAGLGGIGHVDRLVVREDHRSDHLERFGAVREPPERRRVRRIRDVERPELVAGDEGDLARHLDVGDRQGQLAGADADRCGGVRDVEHLHEPRLVRLAAREVREAVREREAACGRERVEVRELDGRERVRDVDHVEAASGASEPAARDEGEVAHERDPLRVAVRVEGAEPLRRERIRQVEHLEALSARGGVAERAADPHAAVPGERAQQGRRRDHGRGTRVRDVDRRDSVLLVDPRDVTGERDVVGLRGETDGGEQDRRRGLRDVHPLEGAAAQERGERGRGERHGAGDLDVGHRGGQRQEGELARPVGPGQVQDAEAGEPEVGDAARECRATPALRVVDRREPARPFRVRDVEHERRERQPERDECEIVLHRDREGPGRPERTDRDRRLRVRDVEHTQAEGEVRDEGVPADHHDVASVEVEAAHPQARGRGGSQPEEKRRRERLRRPAPRGGGPPVLHCRRCSSPRRPILPEPDRRGDADLQASEITRLSDGHRGQETVRKRSGRTAAPTRSLRAIRSERLRSHAQRRPRCPASASTPHSSTEPSATRSSSSRS